MTSPLDVVCDLDMLSSGLGVDLWSTKQYFSLISLAVSRLTVNKCYSLQFHYLTVLSQSYIVGDLDYFCSFRKYKCFRISETGLSLFPSDLTLWILLFLSTVMYVVCGVLVWPFSPNYANGGADCKVHTYHRRGWVDAC